MPMLKTGRGQMWLALMTLCAVAVAVPATAQVKPGNAAGANPIIRDKFTADPAPLAVGDTLYLYVGHGQLYYLTYASLNRKTQRDEHVSYSTAPSITGPWTHRGLLTGSGKYSFTIHPGIAKFKENWYLFLHDATLAIGDMNGAIGRRAVTV